MLYPCWFHIEMGARKANKFQEKKLDPTYPLTAVLSHYLNADHCCTQ